MPSMRHSNRHQARYAWPATLIGAVCLLAGCAVYHPLPLAPRDTSIRDVRQLALDHQHVNLPGLAPHRFDPAHGLDMTDVAMLAVANDPELKLARDDAGVAHAQAFAAGLLPDPQINLSQDFPSALGLVPAFNRGLSFDISSLLTLSSKRRASQAEQQKADLTLLWQEWRVVLQARQQFIKVVFLERSTALLGQSLALTEQRYQAARQALDAGNTTLDAVAPYLTAQEDARRQLADQTRQLQQARHSLNALLGLAPDVRLDLMPPRAYPSPDAQAIRTALRDLPSRRPDLLALSAGYQAQEARVRAAVLAQFPSLNIGFTRARDTSGIYTSGFTATISLPIFNRNRGNIAIETATRQRLHDEYQNRVNAAYADVAQILDDRNVITSQMAAASDAVATLEQTAHAASAAYHEHNITLANYADLQSALLAKKSELLGLQQTSLEQQVALQGLLGGDVPRAGRAPSSSQDSVKDMK